MKTTWLVFLMAVGLALSMTAPPVYAAEDSRIGGLQKMLRKAFGSEEDPGKYIVEKDVRRLLLKVENKARTEGVEVEEYLGSAIAGLKEENFDLSAVDDLLGSMLINGEDAETQEDTETREDTESQNTEEEFTEMPGRTAPGPETVDVGDFIVDVPEGWLGVREPMAIWDEDAADDEFFPDTYSLVKGGQTSQDIKIGNPVIDINYFNDYGAEDLLEMNTDCMEEVNELNLELDGKECTAVHTLLAVGDDSIEYDMVFIPVSDSSCIRIDFETVSYGIQTGLSANDSDIFAIMNSIQMK